MKNVILILGLIFLCGCGGISSKYNSTTGEFTLDGYGAKSAEHNIKEGTYKIEKYPPIPVPTSIPIIK